MSLKLIRDVLLLLTCNKNYAQNLKLSRGHSCYFPIKSSSTNICKTHFLINKLNISVQIVDSIRLKMCKEIRKSSHLVEGMHNFLIISQKG